MKNKKDKIMGEEEKEEKEQEDEKEGKVEEYVERQEQ